IRWWPGAPSWAHGSADRQRPGVATTPQARLGPSSPVSPCDCWVISTVAQPAKKNREIRCLRTLGALASQTDGARSTDRSGVPGLIGTISLDAAIFFLDRADAAALRLPGFQATTAVNP